MSVETSRSTEADEQVPSKVEDVSFEGAPTRTLVARWARWALLAVALWFFGGVLAGAAVVVTQQEAMGQHLRAVEGAALSGDMREASRSLSSAERALRRVDGAMGWPQIRLVLSAPGLSRMHDDGRALLQIGHRVIALGHQALGLAAQATGEDSTLVRDDVIDLELLRELSTGAEATFRDLEAIRADLEALQIDRWELGLRGARDDAISDIDALFRRTAPARDILPFLPFLMGSQEPVSYVIAILNPTELRFSGGAPLGLAHISVDAGHMSVDFRGQTFDLTDGHAHIEWVSVEGDPWHTADATSGLVRSRLVNANFSANWPTAGEQVLRAFTAQFGRSPRGLIAIDAEGLSDIMAVVGPIEVEGYGQISAENLVEALVVESYAEQRDFRARHRLNDAVMDVLLDRLMSGRHLLPVLEAMRQAAAERHVTAFVRHREVHAVLDKHHLNGGLPWGGTDFLGVYTQNTNASKVDGYQERTIRQTVELRRDGTAVVRREIALLNDTPPYRGEGADPGSGYLTSISEPYIAVYVPRDSSNHRVFRDGLLVPHRTLGPERGRTALATGPARIEQGASLEVVVEYELPRAGVTEGSRMRYELKAAAQPLLREPELEIVLQPGPGMTITNATLGQVDKGAVVFKTKFNRDFTLTVELEIAPQS